MVRWQSSPIAAAVERFAGQMAYADVGWGDADRADGWFDYEALGDAAFADRVLARLARDYKTTGYVSGTSTFRAAHYLPLALAGFLFASESRVPILHNNVALLDRQFLNGIRILEPQAIVLASDSAARSSGCVTAPTINHLADCLFAEVSCMVAPVLSTFQARKWVAPANAWNIVMDYLAYGFLAAGRAGLGLDVAWQCWERAIAGRSFPARRRPRRLQFRVDNKAEEMMVQSHCCLRFTLPQSREAEHRYCASCYLESDECRIRRLFPPNIGTER